MNAIADREYGRKIKKMTFGGLKSYYLFRKNADTFVWERYLKLQKRKCFDVLHQLVMAGKDYRLQLEQELRKRKMDADALDRAIASLIKLQANIRRRQTMRVVRDRKIQVSRYNNECFVK